MTGSPLVSRSLLLSLSLFSLNLNDRRCLRIYQPASPMVLHLAKDRPCLPVLWFFRPKKTCNCPILPLIQIHLRNHKKLSSIPDDFLCMKRFLFRKCEYRNRRSISGADHHGGMKPHASYRHPHILYLLI